MTRTRASRFLGNVGWSVSAQVVVAALNLALIPMLVHGLGLELYGLYVLLTAAINYLSTFSLGAGTTTVKFVAQAVGRRDGKAVRDAARWSALLHAVGPLCACAGLAAWAPLLARRLFHIAPEHLAEAAFVLRCAAASGLFWAASQWALELLQGAQRFDLQNIVAVLQTGVTTAGAALIVRAGGGLSGATLWNVAVNAAAAVVALALYARYVRPELAALPDVPGVPAAQFARWSLLLWLGPLAWLITFQADKLFIARAASLSALSLYAVPAGLLQRLQIVPASISSVAVPMMSELSGSHEDMRRVYLKAQRFLLWLVLPMLAGLFALMPQFLGLWLGGDFGARSVWPARLLVAAQLFWALNMIPNAAAAGRDRPGWLSAVAWGQAIVSVVAWRLLIPRYELLGVAGGSLLAQLLPALVYLWAVHALLGVPTLAFWSRALARPALCAGVLLAALLAVHGRVGGWASLILVCAAGGALYAALAWTAALDEDREAFRWALAKARARA